MERQQTKTRGNVIVDNIKVGDIHYEYDMGLGIKCEVITLPILEGHNWNWQSRNVNTDAIIDYSVIDAVYEANEFPGFSAQFGLKLYDYEAYKVDQYI